MQISLRRGAPADAAAAGDICYRAFKAIAEAHNFTPDLPGPDVAAGLLSGLIGHERFFDVVAEIDGRIVGSNFLDERSPIAGVGPITIDPAVQDSKVGRALMQAVMQRARERGFAGIRLVQAGYHNRSLVLYLKLGFDARDHLACLQGPAIGMTVPGCSVRPATMDDLPDGNRLCFRIHGHDRGGELADAITQGVAQVVERAGRITGYATPLAYFGHAVGETVDDIKALIAAAPSFPGPGFLVPTRNGELMRWCLAQGLRVTHTMTLMTIGLYNEPDGAWLPSVLY
ncbi:MAG TPA: GNAT family N-acetyltransferase [Rhizomicrobium sp.]|jgi:predicted N-acetyltransferase YhbS|nr:GNAT family N-acetyltransferase [Rhizomicrobium sp.]